MQNPYADTIGNSSETDELSRTKSFADEFFRCSNFFLLGFQIGMAVGSFGTMILYFGLDHFFK